MTLVTVDDKGHKRCLQSRILSGETPTTTSVGPSDPIGGRGHYFLPPPSPISVRAGKKTF